MGACSIENLSLITQINASLVPTNKRVFSPPFFKEVHVFFRNRTWKPNVVQHKVKQQPRQNTIYQTPHHNWYPNMTWSLRVEYATSHVCHYVLRRWRGYCYESAQPAAAMAFTDIALTSAPPPPMCRFGGGGRIQPYVFFFSFETATGSMSIQCVSPSSFLLVPPTPQSE